MMFVGDRIEKAGLILRGALGNAIEITLPDDPQPAYVAQYFTVPSAQGNFDPRQHAIGLTFCVPVGGELTPQGEAISFKWFDPHDLPDDNEFGFGQDRVVRACLSRVRVPDKQ